MISTYEKGIEEMLLEKISADRNNNLNLLRLVSAIMVIYCHAYPLGMGGGIDGLGKMTKGQMHFGSLAVCVFFFFSGFLINRSLYKGWKARDFLGTRCIRIFPCLFAVIFICTFVLGSFVTEYSLKRYLTDGQTYKYLLNSIFILKHNLPGVFENNIYGPVVNGSLWTLPVEFLCYVVCYLAWKFGVSKEEIFKYTLPIFGFGYIVMHILLESSPLLQSALCPCGMFYAGMLYDTYKKRIHIEFFYVILCLIGLTISIYFALLKYGVILFLPYVLVYIAFGTKKKLSRFGNKHEISYGMYLSAWPIQQTVIMIFHGIMNPILNFLISLPFILLAGFLLNICIERPLANYWSNKIKKDR